MSNFTGKTCLLVDDDEDFRLQAQMLLEKSGFSVIQAEGLMAADKVLAEKRPDLVIADLMMEFMDAGFVLCHHVKKKDPSIPVILVTSVMSDAGMEFDPSSPEERAWIKADAVLTKPVRGEQLNSEISRLLEG